MKDRVVFSTRANMVCRFSDPAQRIHFLSWGTGFLGSECFICGSKRMRSYLHLHCDTCNLDFHKHCYVQPRCHMSDITKPHNLQTIFGKLSICSVCQRPGPRKRDDGSDSDDEYYHCATCNVDIHNSIDTTCRLYPPEIIHPFHPLHPLKFTFSSSEYSYSDLFKSKIRLPHSWTSVYSDSESEDEDSEPEDASLSEAKCNCCRKQLDEDLYYHCSICNFSLNLTCTRDPPPPTILSVENHKHPLTFFPRRISLPCDLCGTSLNNSKDHVYTCHLCNYMVHKTCIYLPRVIKITRHPHRLSISSSLPPGLFSCGVCRRPVNVTCGQFSCVKGCHYAVHSKCAVSGKVWDGKDLEGVPEEPEEDVEPFVRIDDETIQHFSHAHYLKFHGTSTACNEYKFCEACILPIMESDKFYSCIKCNFLLHEECASLPHKKDHPVHKHPLILHPVPPGDVSYSWKTGPYAKHTTFVTGIFKCSGCDQIGCGFVYKCSDGNCEFQLDIRCVSLSDPAINGCHPHDLFFNLTKGECMGCKSSDCSPFSLECMDCKLFLGLKCATLPSVIYYKYDRHPLTLCYGENDTTSGQYWCELCEAKLDATEWFYKCDEYCGVTVHIICLLGKERFLKPLSLVGAASTIDGADSTWSVLRNDCSTRVFCKVCKCRCTAPFLFKVEVDNFCSLHCAFKVKDYRS